MKIKTKKKNQSQIELAAEKFARILIQQAMFNRNKEIKGQMENKHATTR